MKTEEIQRKRDRATALLANAGEALLLAMTVYAEERERDRLLEIRSADDVKFRQVQGALEEIEKLRGLTARVHAYLEKQAQAQPPATL